MKKLIILFLLITSAIYGQDIKHYRNIEADNLPSAATVDTLIAQNVNGQFYRLKYTDLLNKIKTDYTEFDLSNYARLDIPNTFTAFNTFNGIELGASGWVFKGGQLFLHNFQHPTGGTVQPSGHNVFLGHEVGNLTLGSTAVLAENGSWNYGFGYRVLPNATTAMWNVGIGDYALEGITSGRSNIAIGSEAQRNGQTTTFNTSIGSNTLLELINGNDNMAIGKNAMQNVITGSYNVSMGRNSGFFIANNALLTNASHGVLVGYDARTLNDNSTNEIVIGSGARGNGNNTATIGSTAIQQTVLSGSARLRSASDMGANEYDLATKKYVDDIALTGVVLPSNLARTDTVEQFNDTLRFAGVSYYTYNTNDWHEDAIANLGYLYNNYEPLAEQGYALENIAVGDIVYMDTQYYQWRKASASDLNHVRGRLAIVSIGGNIGELIGVRNKAVKLGANGMTKGQAIYLGVTAGTMTNVAPADPNYVRVVGSVVDDNSLYINPQTPNWIKGDGSNVNGVAISGTGSQMTYPLAGIPLSTGAAWGTSITNNSANWNTAYGWGNHANLYHPLNNNIMLNDRQLRSNVGTDVLNAEIYFNPYNGMTGGYNYYMSMNGQINLMTNYKWNGIGIAGQNDGTYNKTRLKFPHYDGNTSPNYIESRKAIVGGADDLTFLGWDNYIFSGSGGIDGDIKMTYDYFDLGATWNFSNFYMQPRRHYFNSRTASATNITLGTGISENQNSVVWAGEDGITFSAINGATIKSPTGANPILKPFGRATIFYKNGWHWISGDLEGTGQIAAINDLTDVIITGTPTTGQVIKYDGANWVNGTDNSSGGSSYTFSAPLSESNGVVSLNQSALSITESQISNLAHLTEAQVDAMVANNGYSTGAHTVDTDDQSAAEVLMTGYVKPLASGAISAADNVSAAIGKLEKTIEDAVAGGGEMNVQSDWNVSDVNSDAYILNKPAAQTLSFNAANQDLTISGNNSVADLTSLATANLTYDAGNHAIKPEFGGSAIIPIYSGSETGLVPPDVAGGTEKFLREDGTWALTPNNITGIDFNAGNGIAITQDNLITSGQYTQTVSLGLLNADWDAGNTFKISAGSFYQNSMRSLKMNITPFAKSGLDIINSLGIVNFDYIKGQKNNIGIIADDAPKEITNDRQEAVNINNLIFLQAKAIQELDKKVKELEARIKTLENAD